ncbi:MAG TPA: fluoride efflux transporter CrcB, partial [Candidatus Hydrogenedentes bacterium]|nr:fluoride efflux transporter CrcB [Candidatus Hydrogenedentota bacterium]
YLINAWVLETSKLAFPLGTLAVNVIGCFLIGLFYGVADSREWVKPEMRLLLVVGVLGGFTTFSAFGYDSFELIRSGRTLALFVNVLAQVALGLLAVAAGHWAGRAI